MVRVEGGVLVMRVEEGGVVGDEGGGRCGW